MSEPVPAGAPATSRLSRGWAFLREALAGREQDYTKGPIGRAVFLLAIPMVLEMAMESLLAVWDVYFVSRLGSDAVTAVGLTESMLTLLYAVAIGLSMGTTAMVSRRIGEKDPEGAAVAAVQSVAVGGVVAVVVAVPGVLFAPDLLRLMGAPEEVVRDGAAYTAVMFGGSATILLLFLLNAAFRGAGDAAIAMRVLWLANGINIALDPCLIFGLGPFPELGLTGGAISTTIGRGIGVVVQLWTLFGGRGRLRVARERLRLVPAVMARLARVSMGGVGQFLIATGSWLGLVRIIALSGADAVAGYTIAIRIIVFTILPSWGMSNAAATLMGQNLGAGQPDRAAVSVWRTGLYNMVFLLAVAATFILFPGPVVRIFSSEPEVVRYAVDCLRFIGYGYGFYAWGMVMVQAFNGAGDTATPTVINFFCYWMFQIPLAWILAREVGLGARGVFVAITLAESLLTVVAILAFRRGRWRTRRL